MINVYSIKMDRYISGLFLINKNQLITGDCLVRKIKSKFPKLSEASIMMKLSNIKALCNKYSISTNIMVGVLSNFSKQNEEAFVSIAKKLQLI